jgi:hypothetical protein
MWSCWWKVVALRIGRHVGLGETGEEIQRILIQQLYT